MSLIEDDSQENDVFEIQDYTTASDWERFVASLEEIIHNWELISDGGGKSNQAIDFSSIDWQEKIDTIHFSEVSFTVTYQYANSKTVEEIPNTDSSKEGETFRGKMEFPSYLNDLMNLKNGFRRHLHCLVGWYGLREFITVCPSLSGQAISPSNTRILLSSFALAVNNTGCHIPIFVQTSKGQDEVYLGVALGNGLRTDFEMASFNTCPPHYFHLTGLLDIFKNKIGAQLTSSVLISIRFTYVLREWPIESQCAQPSPDIRGALSNFDFTTLCRLPFGALDDPLRKLLVSTTWPCINEYNLMNSEAQANLHPSSASIWSACVDVSYFPNFLLTDHVMMFIGVCTDKRSIPQILGPEFDSFLNTRDIKITNTLDRLASPHSPVISSPLTIRSQVKSGPLDEQTISVLLNCLFCDVESSVYDSVASYENLEFTQVPHWSSLIPGQPEEHPLALVLSKFKSCPVDCFVWRLSIIICHIVFSLGDVPALAHFMYEVNAELRFRWDNAILIPGLAEGIPDMSSCILYQKLQMLNCCILHRIKSEEAIKKESHNLSAEEEEFFECEEYVDKTTLMGTSSSDLPSWDKPEGRLKRLDNLRLVNGKDYLYVPVTQDTVPYTEDSLEEQTEELLRLGEDHSGSYQRAKIMSASLLSDMESFKSANPNAQIEDFVRWYSPRDWIEDDPSRQQQQEEEEEGVKRTARGHLSNRMLLPGNLWMKVWEDAKPVPARRQKRLFDDAREAEKVLNWFSQLTPNDLCDILLPVLMHAAVCRLAEEPILFTLPAVDEASLPTPLHEDSLFAQLELIAKRIGRLTQLPSDIKQYKSLQFQLEAIEHAMVRAQSLRVKLIGHSVPSPRSIMKYRSSALNDQLPSEYQSTDDVSSESDRKLASLETLISELLTKPDVVLEDGPDGFQANAIYKLFRDNHYLSFECEDLPSTSNQPNDSSKQFQKDVNLGHPENREFFFRAHTNYPVDHSRTLPHCFHAIASKDSFKMSGAITQDVLFC